MKVTMVLALYDIKRETRSIDEYIVWLKATIMINANIILYTKKGLMR